MTDAEPKAVSNCVWGGCCQCGSESALVVANTDIELFSRKRCQGRQQFQQFSSHNFRSSCASHVTGATHLERRSEQSDVNCCRVKSSIIFARHEHGNARAIQAYVPFYCVLYMHLRAVCMLLVGSKDNGLCAASVSAFRHQPPKHLLAPSCNQ